jgi:integrase
MALTDTEIKKLKARDTEYQKSDGNGLVLVIRPKGTKTWRYEFRLNEKKYKHHYGNYPEISLVDARRIHIMARELVSIGKHPSSLLDNPVALQLAKGSSSIKEIENTLQQIQEIEASKSLKTFGDAARIYKADWVDKMWKNPDKGWSPVRLHLLPRMEYMTLESIDVHFIRKLMHDIRERKGVAIALLAHGWADRIFNYSIEHDFCKNNPASLISAKRIGVRVKRERWLKPQEIKRYLIALYQLNSYRGYKIAVHLALMLAFRIEELCGASWSEVDFENRKMTISAQRMKNKREHVVMLPDQAIEMLWELKRLGGGSDWVLPMVTNQNRPMRGQNLRAVHDAALISGNIEDYRMHDHRHYVSTSLRNRGHDHDAVEAALSHNMGGIAGTYSHANYEEIRLKMMQDWADFLDSIMTEQAVVSATFRKVI